MSIHSHSGLPEEDSREILYVEEALLSPTPILELPSASSIEAALDTALEEYPDDARRYIHPDIFHSEYYHRITRGTLIDLIRFLRSFERKSACGYLHETERQIHGILLSPQNCRYKEGYAGCGHPEKNGLLIAMTIAQLLLSKLHPSVDIGAFSNPPSHIIHFYEDSDASLIYAKYTLEKNPDGSIPISSQVRSRQEALASETRAEAHFLADRLAEIICGEIEEA